MKTRNNLKEFLEREKYDLTEVIYSNEDGKEIKFFKDAIPILDGIKTVMDMDDVVYKYGVMRDDMQRGLTEYIFELYELLLTGEEKYLGEYTGNKNLIEEFKAYILDVVSDVSITHLTCCTIKEGEDSSILDHMFINNKDLFTYNDDKKEIDELPPTEKYLCIIDKRIYRFHYEVEGEEETLIVDFHFKKTANYYTVSAKKGIDESKDFFVSDICVPADDKIDPLPNDMYEALKYRYENDEDMSEVERRIIADIICNKVIERYRAEINDGEKEI